LSEGNLFHFPYWENILEEGSSRVPHKRFYERLELLTNELHAQFKNSEEHS
jgi:hypothetical protein